jgi:CarD family transcriptional regulator
LQLTEGLTVIHPHHGPATVLGATTRKIRGEAVEYIELRICETGLNICIPLAKAQESGLRAVAGDAMLDDLVGVLTQPSGPVEKQWARRFKAQRMEVATGDPMRIAAVVRDLVRRREEHGISLGERDLLKEAAAPLVAEIALAVNISESKARAAVESLVLEGDADVLNHLDDIEPLAA